MLAIIAISLLISFGPFSVSAQQAGSPNWGASQYYQGDSGSVTITLTDNHSYQICTKQFYLTFDWMPSNQVWASSDTSCIATGETRTFTIGFSIPSDVSVG
ncbi:MAG TPA: hypothetical protein VFF30_08220 [Nitrososphaerales archaeon]|nr:hypothetical protein [Nitrososphaerales archaeon]